MQKATFVQYNVDNNHSTYDLSLSGRKQITLKTFEEFDILIVLMIQTIRIEFS